MVIMSFSPFVESSQLVPPLLVSPTYPSNTSPLSTVHPNGASETRPHVSRISFTYATSAVQVLLVRKLVPYFGMHVNEE